jgi:hypothetical protein
MTTVKEVLKDSEKLFTSKEQDYGESWRLTGKILAAILEQQDEDELVIPADPKALSAFGLFTRKIDKLVRSFNGVFIQDELEVDENLAETAQDQIPYDAMLTVLFTEMQQQKQQTNDESSRKKEVGDHEPWQYCPRCASMSSGSLQLEDSHKREYYCKCGHVWQN